MFFPLKPATMAKCVILLVVILAASVVTNWAAMYVSERNSRGMPPPPLPQLQETQSTERCPQCRSIST